MIDPNQFLTGSGSPAAKFPTIGTTVAGTITTEPTVVQQTAFGTNEPLAWADGSPRLQMVVEVNTAEGPQRFFIKAGLKNAVADAVRAAGVTGLQVGGALSVTYTGDLAPTRPGIAGAKVYAASYTAPAPVPVAVPAGPPIVPAPKVSVPTAPPLTAEAALAALA
jgi:hypothetical protein